jgi:hypothetical protein
VVTPGYRVTLEAGGVTYEYHTDQRGAARLAGQQAAASQPTATAAPAATTAPTSAPTARPQPTATARPAATATAIVAQPTPRRVPTSAWLGEYYANETLSGAPALVREDKNLRFDGATTHPPPLPPFITRCAGREGAVRAPIYHLSCAPRRHPRVGGGQPGV